MAENPATWGKAERIVNKVLDEHFTYSHKVIAGEEEPLCGLSLVRKITDALREAELLSHDQPYETCHFCHRTQQ
jgi:hypothetical protein